ncbi:MAG: hypothetical protein GY719_03380 [bacterium]|nr:hypothetical protein [bacterium]
MTIHAGIARTSILIACFCCLVLLGPTEAAFATTSNLCARASSISSGDTVRGDAAQAGEPDCFRLETPAAGLLMLDVAVPGASGAEARLGVLDSSCSAAADLAVIEQSAAHLLAASDFPRSLVVCVGAQDPRHALGEYKLRTAFQELGRDPEQVEVDPDGRPGIEPIGMTRDPEQVEVDPDGGPEADPFDSICRAAQADDHADAFLCATPLALDRRTRGEIANGWSDDVDFFVFELETARTVRIETAGEADTFGGLYDRQGQRLAAAGDGGAGSNFRLVKTLAAGFYFVRVEGRDWSQGAYTLGVETLRRSW